MIPPCCQKGTIVELLYLIITFIFIIILSLYLNQTGKLGSFRRDLGGTTAVKSKGRGEKSDPGAGAGAARGAKRNTAMYMSNEYRYLKSILFNYYAGHGTGVHQLCRHAALLRRKYMGIQGRKNFSP